MSEVKVNKISPRTACGTVTLGDSGDTFTIPSGATITNSGTASGFGATGAVNWDVASIKTATFTAVSGNGYFCNTSGGAFNITLPASPSAGDIVGLKDYASTFNTYNLTIDRNGSNLDAAAINKVISANYTSMTLVYVDGTEGWKPVEEGTGYIGENFIVATGGTPCAGTTCGDYKIHTFTGPGTFCVSQAAYCAANNLVSYMVVAGGGGSGTSYGGGGGAGGFRELVSPTAPYTASPLEGYPTPANRITVSATGYPITVGAGGTLAWPGAGSNGDNSVFSTITSAGGGLGGSYNSPSPGCGSNGGSGGGSADGPKSGGTGNTPPVTPSQGNDGGDAPAAGPAAAGGGATAVGGNQPGGNGGAGATTSISGTPTAYAGGGGGAGPAAGSGGAGGGGAGTTSGRGTAGTVNTGGGAGGSYDTVPPAGGRNGGSGIVIIRYKFQ